MNWTYTSVCAWSTESACSLMHEFTLDRRHKQLQATGARAICGKYCKRLALEQDLSGFEPVSSLSQCQVFTTRPCSSAFFLFFSWMSLTLSTTLLFNSPRTNNTSLCSTKWTEPAWWSNTERQRLPKQQQRERTQSHALTSILDESRAIKW